MNRIKISLDHKSIRRFVWLVLTAFSLLGYSLQSAAGTAYHSILMQAYGTITSPPIILEEGTAGSSAIYTNSTSAKVSVTVPKANNTENYVDIDTSNVDNSADKGTHGNFSAQQYGPDSILDSLTEQGLPSPDSGSKYAVTGSASEITGAPDQTFAALTKNQYCEVTDYEGGTGVITQVYFNITYYGTVSGTLAWAYQLDGGGWNSIEDLPEGGNATSPLTRTYNATNLRTSWTWSNLNTTDLQFQNNDDAGPEDAFVDAIYVTIVAVIYEIDLEVQWTTSDYDETCEEVAINIERENSHSLDATGGYMIVGDGNVDWGSTTGTISFWVKMDSTVQGRFWGQNGDMETSWSGTNLLLDWGGTGSMTSAYSFSADTWCFVAIVWDETNDDLLLYIGDENNPPSLDANSLSGTWTSTTPSPTENRFLNGLDGDEPVDGHGDELRYWNVARNLTQLQSDYDVELTGSESNLRSYFKLNGNFDDVGPDNNDGSGTVSYSFSSDTPFDQEDIQVDVWNGSTWQNLFTNLTNGWNNASVSSYLASSNLTIRFKGGNETSDKVQDTWYVDTNILHTWTPVETTYDYVLRVNNTVPDLWKIRLKAYDDSDVNRLENCTIYFHNSTDGTSSQIVIETGAFVNETGAWYDLGSFETIYIAVTVEANSTGTSYVNVYLEILTLNTTTYAQYIITFEIT